MYFKRYELMVKDGYAVVTIKIKGLPVVTEILFKPVTILDKKSIRYY